MAPIAYSESYPAARGRDNTGRCSGHDTSERRSLQPSVPSSLRQEGREQSSRCLGYRPYEEVLVPKGGRATPQKVYLVDEGVRGKALLVDVRPTGTEAPEAKLWFGDNGIGLQIGENVEDFVVRELHVVFTAGTIIESSENRLFIRHTWGSTFSVAFSFSSDAKGKQHLNYVEEKCREILKELLDSLRRQPALGFQPEVQHELGGSTWYPTTEPVQEDKRITNQSTFVLGFYVLYQRMANEDYPACRRLLDCEPLPCDVLARKPPPPEITIRYCQIRVERRGSQRFRIEFYPARDLVDPEHLISYMSMPTLEHCVIWENVVCVYSVPLTCPDVIGPSEAPTVTTLTFQNKEEVQLFTYIGNQMREALLFSEGRALMEEMQELSMGLGELRGLLRDMQDAAKKEDSKRSVEGEEPLMEPLDRLQARLTSRQPSDFCAVYLRKQDEEECRMLQGQQKQQRQQRQPRHVLPSS
eukprot:TRINITY_DN22448_c0_g1_i2.p1 TRINITY_DN22448_c0_g1~~TRINITY_DN22448_c0_g1_i2.p1  ORF type:complete len:470 (-),score=102.79 TRINITY_DN22448_c0_g1_i2:485-1894(-)